MSVNIEYSPGWLNTKFLKLDASNDPITGDLLIKPTSNSTTTFGVQQADGTSVFNVDTTNKLISFGDNNITNVGDISLGTISSDAGTSISVLLGTDAGDDFIVGNNNALVVTGDNDRVGIGTNNPGFKLHVSGSSIRVDNTSAAGIYANRTSGKILGLVGGGGGCNFRYDSSGNFSIQTQSRTNLELANGLGLTTVLLSNSSGHVILTNLANPTINARFTIKGYSNEVQQIIQANSTQTANLTEWQDDLGEIGIAISGDTKELQFYDTGASNYVGFKAPALTANQIWTLPTADGADGQLLSTDGAGVMAWVNGGLSNKSITFDSPAGSSGTFYYGGFYLFGTDNDFNPSITFGTANSSYAAHFFLVQAAGASGGTDTVIRITGTSITDAGVRTTSDTQDLTVDDAGVAGTYYETSKKWIGQVTVAKQSGPDLICNYGFTKYWDNNNTDFTLLGVDTTWLGGANDSAANISIIHHKSTGWTYNAGAAPTPPVAVADMNSDHNTEINIVNNENGAWKQDGLNEDIVGSTNEGTILEITTASNKTFELGNMILHIRSN